MPTPKCRVDIPSEEGHSVHYFNDTMDAIRSWYITYSNLPGEVKFRKGTTSEVTVVSYEDKIVGFITDLSNENILVNMRPTHF